MFVFGFHVLEKSLLNASKLSYRGFGTHRCATEDTCPYESRLSATCMHRTYINNPDVRYGLQRSPLQYRQKRLCEQEGADMAVTVQTRRERVNADAPKCNKETSAYLMTMLSEMLSAVETDALGSIVHCERNETTPTKGRRTKKKKTISQTAYKKHKAFCPHIPSISSRLSLLTNHSAAAFALRGSVRSIGSQTSWPGCSPIPSFSIRAIAWSAFSSLLAARYTLAPRLTRWSAMYRPIPEL